MKILIFTDSHGYNVSMACAVEREAPDMVLHLGDHMDDARELESVFPRLTVCGQTRKARPIWRAQTLRHR